jgi:hypothetical protein
MTPTLTTRTDLDQMVCPDCDGDDTEGLYFSCDEHPDIAESGVLRARRTPGWRARSAARRT